MGNNEKGVLLSLLSINRNSREPIYRQLENQIRNHILQSILKTGTRLPSSRLLADELGVSRPTVTHVIDALVAEGFLETIPGSGTFVASKLPQNIPVVFPASNLEVVDNDAHTLRLSRMGQELFYNITDIEPQKPRPLLPNYPALESFSHRQWQKCLIHHARQQNKDLMGYSDLMGYLPLRENLAEYLNVYRGANCTAEQILITPGGHFAFMLTLLLLTEEKDKIWFEDPGPHVIRRLFESLGRTLVNIDVDNDGMDVHSAIAQHPDARLAFVMPSRQHPLGVTLSLPRRMALLEWATQNNSWILEDDYDSEFRYQGRPFASMSSIDPSGRVIYSGTFSKSMYPSLRVGYLILPKQLIVPFQRATGLIARSVSTDLQIVLADFIERGYFSTHIRSMKKLYAQRQKDFIQMAQEILGDLVTIDVPDSGMNIIFWLKDGLNDWEIAQKMAELGITIYPMSDYCNRPHYRQGLILGFTATPTAELIEPLRQLKKAISETQKTS